MESELFGHRRGAFLLARGFLAASPHPGLAFAPEAERALLASP